MIEALKSNPIESRQRVPHALITLSHEELKTGKIDSAVDHFGEVDPRLTELGVNLSLPPLTQGVVNVKTSDAIMEGLSFSRTDVSHIAAMSDETLTDILSQPVEPRLSTTRARRSFPRTLFKNAEPYIVAGATATAAVVVAPAIFHEQSQVVSAQDVATSAEPSAQPSGLVENSPTPDPETAENPCPPGQIPVKPSPTPSPEPSRTPVIAIAPLQEVVLVKDTDTDINEGPNQETASAAPSAAPSAEPGASAIPDPRTAGIECIPDPNASPSPKPTTEPSAPPSASASPDAGKTAEPEQLPPAMEALEVILTQKDEDIDKIKPGKIRGLVDALWAGNPELDTFVMPFHPDIPFSKEEISGYLDSLFDKKDQFRIENAGNGIAMLFAVYNWEEKMAIEGEISIELSTQARKAISNLADRIFDYSIIELTVRGNKDVTRKRIAEVSKSSLEFNLSYVE